MSPLGSPAVLGLLTHAGQIQTDVGAGPAVGIRIPMPRPRQAKYSRGDGARRCAGPRPRWSAARSFPPGASRPFPGVRARPPRQNYHSAPRRTDGRLGSWRERPRSQSRLGSSQGNTPLPQRPHDSSSRDWHVHRTIKLKAAFERCPWNCALLALWAGDARTDVAVFF